MGSRIFSHNSNIAKLAAAAAPATPTDRSQLIEEAAGITKYRERRLGILTAVHNRKQQLSIDAGKLGQAPGVYAIVLSITPKDEFYLARIRDDHLVPAFPQHTVGPT